MNAASSFLLFRLLPGAVLFFTTMVPVSMASYFEDWIVEAEVLEEPGDVKTLEGTGETAIALKIKVVKCELEGGHGKNKCKPEQLFDILMIYKGEGVTEKIEKGSVLKMKYSYGDGMGPKGVVYSHRWEFVEVIR